MDYKKEMGALDFLFIAPQTLLLQLQPGLWMNYGKAVVAIDRNTGVVRWRKSGALIGVASAPREIIVMAEEQSKEIRGARDEDYHIDFSQRLQGVDAVSGKTLWQDDKAPLSVRAFGVYSGIIVVASWVGKTSVRYREASTGAVMNPSSPAVAARLKRITTQFPTLVAWSKLIPHFRFYLPWRNSFLMSLQSTWNQDPHLADARHVIASEDQDDGRTGGSQDPKYLSYMKLDGKEVWKFPSVFRYDGDPQPTSQPMNRTAAEDRYRVEEYKLLEGTGLLAAKDWGGTVYLLRTQNGKQQWPRLFDRVEVADVVAYGKDLLALTYPKRRPNSRPQPIPVMSLRRINRRTGEFTQAVSVPAGRMFLNGDTLYLHTDNRVCAYALRVLFHQPKSPR